MSRAKPLARTRAQARKRPHPGTPPVTGPSLAGKKRNAVLCVLLAVATTALYCPVIGCSFVIFDDQDYVTANPHIHGGLAWSTIKWAFKSTDSANWHPLTWLSHALDYQLFALNPAGHHLDSVLIHALNAVLLFLLLVWVTKRVGPSLLVAALFALHPLNVESVAWVAERKNVLSTLFFFLAIAAYAWYARKPEWRRYLLMAALFAGGLMAKPMVITLPFVLLLMDYWPLDRMALDGAESGSATLTGEPRVAFSTLVLEKIPLLVLSGASAWITLIAQRTAVGTFEEFPFGIRVENAVVSYGLYLWKMLWPARLAFYLFAHPVIALPVSQLILSALVLIGVTTFVIAFRGKRYLPVGWFWFLGTLVPVIGLVQVGEARMADRYAYIPLIGIFVMIAWSLDDWAEARKIRTVWRVVPAVCALAALSYVTHRQMSHWESEYDLWSHTLEVGESAFAHNAVGTNLMNPEQAMTQHDLRKFDTEQERMDEARRHFERALALHRQAAEKDPREHLPEMAITLISLGTVDRLQNRMDEARGHYEEALKIRRQLAQQNPSVYLPEIAKTLISLGALDLFQNRLNQGQQHYEEALKIGRQLAQQNPAEYVPEMATTLANLGTVEGRQNRIEEARAHYQEALSLLLKLSQGDKKYAGDVANVEASLQELDKRVEPR